MELEVAFAKITQTYQRLMPKLALTLNAMHGMSGSVRFWAIQLGLPFMYFIATAYEIRFRLLQAAEIFRGQEWHLATPKDMHLKLDTHKLWLDQIGSMRSADNWALYAEVAITENLPIICTDIDPATLIDRAEPLELVDRVKFKTHVTNIILSLFKI